MATSNYTTNLHLCDWSETDRPKRADFVSDNNIIDTTVGGHILDTGIHLTSAEKAKLTEPFVRMVYAGSGDTERTIELGFTPKFVAVFRRGVPPTVYSDSINYVNSGYACYGYGNTIGISLTSSGVTVIQSASTNNGVLVNLNASGGQYTVVAFK